MKLPPYCYIIAAAILIGVLRYSRINPPFIRLFVYFLILTFIAESFPALKIIQFKKSNHWWFNLFTVFEFVFYTYVFSKAIINPRITKILRYAIPAYVAIAAVNIFLIQGVHRFHTISYRIGAVMVITWCYLYFRQLLQSGEEIILLRNPLFWISTGLLFFYLGFFVYMNAFDYIVYNKMDYNAELWTIISYSLNLLLYSCFLIAFLCQGKIRK